MSQDAIIEKLKKLLRMQRGGTAGEIENALAMAAELARKHGIDLAAVDPDECTQKLRHIEDALKSRLPLAAKYAAAILVNFFNISVIVRRTPNPKCLFLERPQYSIVFVGTDLDIEISRYVFGFLQKHFSQSWSGRINRRLKNRAAFLEGMFLGLACKLEAREAVPDKAGLVLISRGLSLREDYIQKHWPKCGRMDLDQDNSAAHAAKYAGLQAGEKTNIRPAINPSAAPARPALPPAAGQLSLL